MEHACCNMTCVEWIKEQVSCRGLSLWWVNLKQALHLGLQVKNEIATSNLVKKAVEDFDHAQSTWQATQAIIKHTVAENLRCFRPALASKGCRKMVRWPINLMQHMTSSSICQDFSFIQFASTLLFLMVYFSLFLLFSFLSFYISPWGSFSLLFAAFWNQHLWFSCILELESPVCMPVWLLAFGFGFWLWLRLGLGFCWLFVL